MHPVGYSYTSYGGHSCISKEFTSLRWISTRQEKSRDLIFSASTFCEKKAILQKVGMVSTLKRSTFSTVFLADINCACVKAIKVESLDFSSLWRFTFRKPVYWTQRASCIRNTLLHGSASKLFYSLCLLCFCIYNFVMLDVIIWKNGTFIW